MIKKVFNLTFFVSVLKKKQKPNKEASVCTSQSAQNCNPVPGVPGDKGASGGNGGNAGTPGITDDTYYLLQTSRLGSH